MDSSGILAASGFCHGPMIRLAYFRRDNKIFIMEEYLESSSVQKLAGWVQDSRSRWLARLTSASIKGLFSESKKEGGGLLSRALIGLGPYLDGTPPR